MIKLNQYFHIGFSKTINFDINKQHLQHRLCCQLFSMQALDSLNECWSSVKRLSKLTMNSFHNNFLLFTTIGTLLFKHFGYEEYSRFILLKDGGLIPNYIFNY